MGAIYRNGQKYTTSPSNAEMINYGDGTVKDALDGLSNGMSDVTTSKIFNNTITITHHNKTKETIIDIDNASINGASYTSIGKIAYKPLHAINGIVLSSDKLLYKTYISTGGDMFIYPINTSSNSQLVFGQLVYFSTN